MFIVLSPAKTLDFESPLPALPPQTEPRFLDDSERLIRLLRVQDPAAIASLMSISDKLAQLNVERYALWQRDMRDEAARPAVFAFRGDVYGGLDIDSFDKSALRAAQARLRILSGLYGLLRPLDRIRPYRLEMGVALANPAGRDLYHFWDDRITHLLADDMRAAGSRVLVNLASQEYFRAVHEKTLGLPVVSPVFEDEKNGKYKIISFYAKRARGLMAAWMLKHGIDKIDELPGFKVAGYRYCRSASTETVPVFRRKAVAAGE